MSVRGIKKQKKKPASANMVRLFDGPDYTVYWKGRARPKRRGAKKPSPPRPKKWVSLVVFLTNPEKRKRSFHVSWNGKRFGFTPDMDRLQQCEPNIYRAVINRLHDFEDRLIKVSTRRRAYGDSDDPVSALLARL